MKDRINISSPEIDIEKSLTGIREVLESGQMAQGPKTKLAEETMANVFESEYGALVANGTVSLRAALIAGIAVKHSIVISEVDRALVGSEVIIPAFSFNATLNSVLQSGATARVVDIDSVDYGLDVEKTKDVLKSNTLAIMPVDLYGQASSITRKNPAFGSVTIIRDAAQAHGAELKGEPIVKHADVVSTSFYPTKNVAGGGEGGGIVTDNLEIAEIVKIYRNQGMSAPYVYEMVGDNLRMTDIQAVILQIGLEHIKEANAKRNQNANMLSSGLKEVEGLILPVVRDDRNHVWHQYTIQVDRQTFGMDRLQLRDKLSENGIGSGIYYPKTMTDHPSYKSHPRIIKEQTPNADLIAQRVLSLPVHPRLKISDIERIVDTIKKIKLGKK